jgi:hypothetical protein
MVVAHVGVGFTRLKRVNAHPREGLNPSPTSILGRPKRFIFPKQGWL